MTTATDKMKLYTKWEISDYESGFVSDEDTISDLNNASVRVDAVAVAGSKIRSIKERERCDVNNLPFNLSNKIEGCLFMWAVSRINPAVTSNSSV